MCFNDARQTKRTHRCLHVQKDRSYDRMHSLNVNLQKRVTLLLRSQVQSLHTLLHGAAAGQSTSETLPDHDNSGSLDLSLAGPRPQAKQNKARTFFIPALFSLFHLVAIFQKEAPTAPSAAESLTLGLHSSFY